MTAQKDEILAMINQLKDRLTDLEQTVLASEHDLEGYAQRIDRLDDKVYLMECEIQKGEIPAPSSNSEDGLNIDPEKVRQEATETMDSLNSVYTESKETFIELKDAIDDITGAIKESPLMQSPIVQDLASAAKSGKYSRRRW